jgi:hypothetical protein
VSGAVGVVRKDVVYTLLVPAGELPVSGRVSLRYFPADPMAVRLVFAGDGIEVEWVMAREYLSPRPYLSADGGDVASWVHGESIQMRLSSPDGEATIVLNGEDVGLFVAATECVVRVGQERVDVDGTIEWLLGAAS